MFHSFIGNLGHLSIIIAFVSAILASYGYSRGAVIENDTHKKWILFSRSIFIIHCFAVLTIVGSLFTIIYNHYYEYYYAWSHSSNNLPTHFMISCFWEGQEGSFLLWMFWQCVLGLVMIFTQKKWEAPMMAVFSLVQAFLASMILGIVFFEIKVGSSPFILLRDFMIDAPIFKSQPEFIPKDGTGLNPLLQNYWMVIHPPTLFLGFATTLIPFSFCIAGLWMGRFKEWIAPALPWAHFSALVLGVGILMGAYWAYETLNFGGYWNWDPVENAVYVPWLILIASIHAMIIFRRNSVALKSAVILNISTFLLVLYSTFLTRSGILGNASVHSFTDLGLSGQLLIYLLAFVILSVFLVVRSWKKLSGSKEETSVYSKEFWIFMGIIALCLSAFQIIFTTSFPVYNAILNAFHIKSNLALPAEQVEHYGKFQVWFSVLITLLSGTAQFFYWKKMDKDRLLSLLYTPLVITLLLSGLIIVLSKITNPAYIILLTGSIYSFVSNLFILINVLKKNPSLSGGAVAHMGIALMLIGVLYSAGYSKVISTNNTGLFYSKEFSTEMNQENVLLWRNDNKKMGAFEVKYKGQRIVATGVPGYINKENIRTIEDPYKAVLTKDYIVDGKTILKQDDTLRYMPENTYFEVAFKDKEGNTFTLFPRAQVNKEMGLIASPDIKKMVSMDIYSHISSFPDPAEEKKWSELQLKELSIGDTFLVNDYYAVLEKVERIDKVEGIALSKSDAAVQGYIKILTKDENVYVNPVFLIHNQMIGRMSEENLGLGIRLTIMNIDPKSGTFTIGINTTQKDWIILKAIEKPFIDLLWVGALIVVAGFTVAMSRRFRDYKKVVD